MVARHGIYPESDTMSAESENQIPLDCVACGKTFQANARQLSKPDFACPHCGDQTVTGMWREELEQVDRMLGRLEKYQDN